MVDPRIDVRHWHDIDRPSGATPMEWLRNWGAHNRPILAAMIAALTPVLVALFSGDLQSALDAWPAVAQVAGPLVLAVVFGYLFGAVAQGGADDPVIGQPLAKRATRLQVGTMPMSDLLDDGPDTPEEADALFADYYSEHPEGLRVTDDTAPSAEEFIAANQDTLGSTTVPDPVGEASAAPGPLGGPNA